MLLKEIGFWTHKILKGRNRISLVKRVLKKKSFRYFREAIFLIRHPFDMNLINVGSLNSPLLVDVGAFDGNFAQKFRLNYRDARFILIEPVEAFINMMPFRSDDTNVIIVNKGLTHDGRNIFLTINDADTSSYIQRDGTKLLVDTISISHLGNILGDQEIHLLQVNCEGGEYEILPALTSSSLIKQVRNIQVQFHFLSPTNIFRHRKIRRELRKTHRLVWSTYFIWERWERL